MVDLVLDDLRREVGVGFETALKLLVQVLHLDRAVTLCPARAGQRQAAFTLDVYGHVSDRMQRESAARMEQYISGISQMEPSI